ncbi:unnamed protein product [Durusdinium trenchii]|uniref:Major facilitator superfamily (MFS) profile domain-containing protein n=1 Tax=Durusdinium trenchii TaxID=1381693 RepID=A0ABP0RAQ7_9DINO
MRTASRAPMAELGVPQRMMAMAAVEPAEYWSRVRALYASSCAVILGNVLEWYDWTVFGYMQDIMKHVFGSGSGEQAWLLFAVPFLARPLGSVLFGWIGDACGRAVSLKLAIWGMAICTVLQGCLVPDSPGVTAQLAVLRIFTGLSAGGESAGVNTYMSEIGDEGREHTLGAAIGVNNLSGSLAFLLANLVSLLVHLLPWEDQVAWGWRVPFLLAAPLGVASILLRRHVPETEAFRRRRDAEKSETSSDAVEISSSESEQPSSDEPKRVPARWGPWTSHFYLLPLVVLVLSAVNSCNYLPIYLVSWLEEEAQLTPPQALSISALAKVVQMLMTFPASFATDLFGTTKVMLLGGSSVAVAAVPLLWLTMASSTVGLWPAFLILGVFLPVLISIYLVPSNLFMTAVFPTLLRARACGICLGLASITGGLTPMIASQLAQEGRLWPGAFIYFLTLPSLAVLLWSRQKGRLAVYQRPWLF